MVPGELAGAAAVLADPERHAGVAAAHVVFPALERMWRPHGVLVPQADRVRADRAGGVRAAGDAGSARAEGGVTNELGAGAAPAMPETAALSGAAHAPKMQCSARSA
jgi:hypothetical protein